MKSLNKSQLIIVWILALLTALEPFSIDLYLPSFLEISKYFNTSMSNVQISLSIFLGGFAIGQLFWGPLADKYGRKKPILISLVIFTLASIASVWVTKIEYLWLMRFFQALGGCAGVVISRAIVSDVFDKTKSLQVYGILMIIMGVAPIIGPIIGNVVQQYYSWKGVFILLAILGALTLLITLFFLPETARVEKNPSDKGVLATYKEIFVTPKFWQYTLFLGLTNSVFMLFLGYAPQIIIQEYGFTSTQFSIIFALNAVGLMIGSNVPMLLKKYMNLKQLIVLCTIGLIALTGLVTLSFMYQFNIYFILVLLFMIVFVMGTFYTVFTDAAMQLFDEKNAASASSLLGGIMIGVSFIVTILAGLIPTVTLTIIGLVLFSTSVLFIIPLLSLKKKFNEWL